MERAKKVTQMDWNMKETMKIASRVRKARLSGLMGVTTPVKLWLTFCMGMGPTSGPTTGSIRATGSWDRWKERVSLNGVTAGSILVV